jgi:hypothetical protein
LVAMNALFSDSSRVKQRAQFELIFASILLGFGLFVLPLVIYWVGAAVLGPYGDSRGLGTFYVDYFKDLAEPSGRAWLIAVGPLAIVAGVRATFIGARSKRQPESDAAGAPSEGEEAHASAPHANERNRIKQANRVEPRVTLD